MEEYQLFPDIKLLCGAGKPHLHDGVGIAYCLDGVMECKTGGMYYYLTSGNYMVYSINECSLSASENYNGLTLALSGVSSGSSVTEIVCDADKLNERIAQKGICIARADGELLRVFSDTLSFHSKAGEAWLKVRAIEMIMLVSNVFSDRRTEYSGKIKAIGDSICDNISCHITISQFSEQFDLNQTTLKETFRQSFGCSIYAYAKCRKMFRAAELILQTDMKIIDIAEEVGYCNASKFAKAFCDVMGTTPRRFRMEHSNVSHMAKVCISPSASY